jgi:hypothetical protein
VRGLRAEGKRVVCQFPGDDNASGDFHFDEALRHIDGQWVLRSL